MTARDRLRVFASRLGAWMRSRDLDADFDRELDEHLTLLSEDNIGRGMSPEEARRAAAIRIGPRASLKARHRDARGLPALESILQDVSFALRLMAKTPWFSAAAIVTLALGIGINAIGFSVVNTAFLRGLPFDAPSSLHVVSWQTKGGRRAAVSPSEFQAWRDRATGFAGLAAYRSASASLSDDAAPPEPVAGSWVSVNAFRVLRQPPLLGRDFSTDDGRPGAEPVVLIGHTIWENRYQSDPAVLGKAIRFNGQPATIVGVMPAGMQFPDNADMWAPLVDDDRGPRALTLFGRLNATAVRGQAQAELNGLAQPFLKADPEASKDFVGIRVETFVEALVGARARTMFLSMMGAVCLVLLIACANVANLLLSRSAARAREIAVRVSLGATRWRVARQLFIESAVLSLVGAGLGTWLAVAGVSAFESATQGSGKPYWMVFTVDYAVFAYVAALCVVTALVFGTAPAMHISKTNNHEVLKDGARGAIGSRRAHLMSGGMVMAELAFTAVLLVAAGLMVRSFLKVYTMNVGIRTIDLIAARVDLSGVRYTAPAARLAFFDRVEERLALLAGVDSVAVTTGVPPFDGGEEILEVEGRGRPDASSRWISTVAISPTFFDVVERPIVRGRGLQDTDAESGRESVVINAELAARVFGGEDPVGKRIRLSRPSGSPGPWRTIVGISPSIRQGSIQDADLNPVAYLLARENPPARASFLVRSGLSLESLTTAIRREVQSADPDQPVLTIQTVDQLVANERWAYRTFGGVFALCGVVALVLSAVGLYGVMANAVSQRTQEFGVRMALGASWHQVLWLVLTRGLRHLAIGLAAGLVGALALSRVMRSLLAQIEPADPITFVSIAVLLSLVALVACVLPASRAARVDPVEALRSD